MLGFSGCFPPTVVVVSVVVVVVVIILRRDLAAACTILFLMRHHISLLSGVVGGVCVKPIAPPTLAQHVCHVICFCLCSKGACFAGEVLIRLSLIIGLTKAEDCMSMMGGRQATVLAGLAGLDYDNQKCDPHY